MTNADKYERITASVLKLIDERGELPWRKPWNGPDAKPKNILTHRPYSGWNVFWLGMQCRSTPWWGTSHQFHQLGGRIRNEEWKHNTWGIFAKQSRWNRENKDTGEKEQVSAWIYRSFPLWNLDQAEGVPPEKIPSPPAGVEHDPIETAEQLLERYCAPPGPAFFHEERDDAFYMPSRDEIHMPERRFFEEPRAYYSVAFHEATHSTGHDKRLKRDFAGYGTDRYALEELIAEFGASFLCAETHIETTLDNSAAYIAHWRQRLTENKDWLVKAASKAQAAAQFVLNGNHVNEEESCPASEQSV